MWSIVQQKKCQKNSHNTDILYYTTALNKSFCAALKIHIRWNRARRNRLSRGKSVVRKVFENWFFLTETNFSYMYCYTKENKFNWFICLEWTKTSDGKVKTGGGKVKSSEEKLLLSYFSTLLFTFPTLVFTFPHWFLFILISWNSK